MPHIERFLGDESALYKMRSSQFFIEANGFEQMRLWEKHEAASNWQHDQSGFWQVVGYVDKEKQKPVCVSFHFAKVYGRRVCFFEPTSRFVDHTMVSHFIDTYFCNCVKPIGMPKRICYASGFADVLNYLKKQ